MLSETDKIWLTNTIKKIVTDALTVKVKYEQVRDPDSGQPHAVPKMIERDEYLPAWWLQYLPFNEGALRGMQEDVTRHCAKIDQLEDKVKVIGNIMIQTENSLKCLASLSDHIKQIGIQPTTEIHLIEDIDDGKSDS
jgi:hypothetical protein